MESLEISAKTVEEAISRALQQLGVSQDQVEVTVLKEGRAGIMGLGAEEAKVRVTLLEPRTGDIAQEAKVILETLLEKLGVTASVSLHAEQPGGEEAEAAPIAFDIAGEDLGILIGRRGQTLVALQYILRTILAHQTKTFMPVILDVEGYKQRYNEKLRALAWRMAEQVRVKGMSITLRPMPAYERRIIHLALAEHPAVVTESTGEGEARRVSILPKRQRSGSK